MPELAALSIYQKLIRIARSSSGDDEKAKAMFVLFSLLALQGKITMIDTMARLRGEVFPEYIVWIYFIPGTTFTVQNHVRYLQYHLMYFAK